MKRIICLILAVLLAFSAIPALAAEGNVTYSGDAGKCIFAPGSKYSPTDLFPNFKGVMPGDRLEQAITVKNDASDKVKIKIYMRSLGAQEKSEEFLSQLRLRVEKAADNKMGYMFDAAADQTAQLTDWVLLGTLYSGGEVDLNVILDVPVELTNEYAEQIGYLDWEFKIEEYPIEKSDPEPPDTGDRTKMILWIAVMVAAAALLILLVVLGRKKKKQDNA